MSRSTGFTRGMSWRPVAFAVLSFVLFVVAWEVYRRIGPERDVGKVFGWKIIPRANDFSMPALTDVVDEFGEPEVRNSDTSVFIAVAKATFYSFRLAVGALLLGATVGLLCAVAMSRFKVIERGLMPYLVISQTIPLIALAPLTVNWGGQISLWGFEWERWMSALVLGAFLSFFPIAVGALRGFNSPKAESLELMNSYAASWWQSFKKLRLPAAAPFLVPALRLAAGAAVFGVVVSEISVGLSSGVGRLVLSYSTEATSRPAKVFTAVAGTVVLGLAMAGLVSALDRYWSRNRPIEGAV